MTWAQYCPVRHHWSTLLGLTCSLGRVRCLGVCSSPLRLRVSITAPDPAEPPLILTLVLAMCLLLKFTVHAARVRDIHPSL